MARRAEDPRWTDPGLLVLCSLADGAKHGYAITGDVERQFGITLGPGTLYGALARLESRHLIEPLAAEDRRRPYRLTAAGERVLQEQLDSMRHFATLGSARLRAGRGPQASGVRA